MTYEDMQMNWAMTGNFVDEEDGDDCLDEYELSRLQYFAEHPDLSDPLIWTLPESGWKRDGRR